MNYQETGFRGFYHRFCTIPITDEIKKALDGYPGIAEADAVLTYGYYDREEGLILEILAPAKTEGENIMVGNPLDGIRVSIRVSAVKEVEFTIMDDTDGILSARYADKLKVLEMYDADEEIEETRNMDFLDECRNDEFIDDIMVFLLKGDLQPELCLVRISGMEEDCLFGSLLNEPKQDFGYHKDDKIAFYVKMTEDERCICFTITDPEITFTPESLKDGKMLDQAIHEFHENECEETFINLIMILRDSKLLIPCKMSYDHEIKMIPDLIRKNNISYLPVFSNREAMINYEEDSPVIKADILNVISLARNEKIENIVLNIDTENFVLNQELWPCLEEIKSHLEDEPEF